MYRFITMAIAVLALAGTGTAFAQMNTSSSQSMNKSAMHCMHHMHGMHAQHMKKRLSRLKARIKITSAQEPAWNSFAQAAENMRPAMNSKMKRQTMSRTAPEVFDGMAMRAQQRARKAQALAKAADHLYGQLSAQQKAAWNKTMMEMHAQMHHGMMHEMHG